MTQHYIGTKQITAWEQEKDGAQGYAVKYADGYTSWSPKDVFEAAYLPMGHVGHLAPHQQRVVGEKVQLDDKIAKLHGFTATDTFASLPEDERKILDRQIDAMTAYTLILARRIAEFPQPEQTYLQQDQGLEPVEYFALDDVAKLTEAERLGVFGYDPIADGSDKA
jgi:hypothetical protein